MSEPDISVLLPTWRRPDSLLRCLAALRGQSRPAGEVIVAVREDDPESRRAVEGLDGGAGVVRAVVVPPGPLTGAMNAGLARTVGGLVALTDDDAEPHPDWLERLARHFDDPAVGGVGGRDWQPAERGEAADVGRVAWFGRVVGNHHLGAGPAREVDLLKGVNCCFRGEALRRIGFDQRLRGRGNVSHWEMSLCFALRREGWRLIYDPAVAVDHHVAARMDGDTNARGGFERASYRDMVHNETLAVLEHLTPVGRLAFGAWAVAVGTREAPGLLQGPRLALGRRPAGGGGAAGAGVAPGPGGGGGELVDFAEGGGESWPSMTRNQPTSALSAAHFSGVAICLAMSAAAILAAAKFGGVRFLDLAVSAAALAGAFGLALSDSRRLPTYVIAAWVFAPLVRRLVDWSHGAYTSVTVVSLVPLLVMSTLLIPTLPRLGRLPGRLRQPLWLDGGAGAGGVGHRVLQVRAERGD